MFKNVSLVCRWAYWLLWVCRSANGRGTRHRDSSRWKWAESTSYG